MKGENPVTIVAAFYWGMRFGESMIASIQKAAPPHWTVFPMHFLRTIGNRLESLHIDGVIADLHTTADVQEAKRLEIPVIDAAGSRRQQQFPLVCTDEEAAGERAMEHLSAAGHTRFAFIGFNDHVYSHQRLAGFARALKQAGLPPPEVIETPWDQDEPDCAAWRKAVSIIKEFPRNTGIFGCSDARLVLLHAFAMSQGESRLFAEHGLVGVDDDRELMRIHGFHFPSIPLDFDKLGQAAVELMEKQLQSWNGKPRKPASIFIPPGKVVAPEGFQQLLHSADPIVEVALRLIRAELSKPFSIPWLAQQLHVSQSTLERRFREHLGQTPKQFIQRLRFDRAAELLTQTDLSLKEISSLVGFEEQRRLSKLFRNLSGSTPSTYRDQNRRK